MSENDPAASGRAEREHDDRQPRNVSIKGNAMNMITIGTITETAMQIGIASADSASSSRMP